VEDELRQFCGAVLLLDRASSPAPFNEIPQLAVQWQHSALSVFWMFVAAPHVPVGQPNPIAEAGLRLCASQSGTVGNRLLRSSSCASFRQALATGRITAMALIQVDAKVASGPLPKA
jgi:hypothetical protein